VLLLIFVYSFEYLAVWPSKDTESMHLIVLPSAIIVSFILPNKFSLSLELIVYKLAIIWTFIGPFELSWFFIALREVSSKIRAIGPILFTYTILEIVCPLPFISNAFIVMKLPKSWSLILLPCSIIVIFIGVDEYTCFMELIFKKVSVVVRSWSKINLSLALQCHFSSVLTSISSIISNFIDLLGFYLNSHKILVVKFHDISSLKGRKWLFYIYLIKQTVNFLYQFFQIVILLQRKFGLNLYLMKQLIFFIIFAIFV
jgi:hypothetical protein